MSTPVGSHVATGAGNLAQLISDSNRATEYISHAQRAEEWQRERAQEAQAIAARTCACCGGDLVEDGREAEWMRCGACSHLVFVGSHVQRKVDKRRAASMADRQWCGVCKRRRMSYLITDGVCRECRA